MECKIGYYFPFNDYNTSVDSYLILVCDNYRCKFRLVPTSLFSGNPLKSSKISYETGQIGSPRTIESYLDYPFIYEENEEGKICEVRMLHDVPIILFPEREEGLCMSQIDKTNYKSSLYFNGIKMHQKIYGHPNVLFYKYAIQYYVLNNEVCNIRKNVAPLTNKLSCSIFFKPIIDYT